MANPETMLEESILLDIRAACNLEQTDSDFDSQILPLLNSQIMMAHQFGVGENGFLVNDTSETWGDLLGADGHKLAAIRTWLGLSVKLLFDPPDNASVLKSYQDQIAKMEWMLCSKSEEEKIVKQFVTLDQAKIYDELDIENETLIPY